MNFELNDEQRMLQDQVRSLLEARSTPELLRSLITDHQPWDRKLWQEFSELGLLGASIPEAYGGVGLTPLELCIIAEEVGRFVAPIPFFSSICAAAEAILLYGTEHQKAAWLPRLASGEVVATLALDEGIDGLARREYDCKFENGRLTGVKQPVPDAGLAALLIVSVQGGRLAMVETGQGTVDVQPVKGFDELRQHARVTFDGAKAELLEGAAGQQDLLHLLDRLAIYEAFEQIGGAEAALNMARDYALQRYIFGRQLASYQAVKHNLANILVKLELARSNALYAAGALCERLASVPQDAAAARLAATGAYETAARENLQVHGGIGFTWEANCHFHYRRARLLALNLGSPAIWTDRLIGALQAGPDSNLEKHV
jgi:acyl-CoA dehydrogenase